MFENANPRFIINQCLQVTKLSYDVSLFTTFRYSASCNFTVIAPPVLPRYANMVRYVSKEYQPFGLTDKNIYF